jgi:hypothetical protein
VWWLTPVIPDTQKVDSQKIIVPRQLWQKISKTPFQQKEKLGVVVHTYDLNYTGDMGRRITVPSWPSYLKNN